MSEIYFLSGPEAAASGSDQSFFMAPVVVSLVVPSPSMSLDLDMVATPAIVSLVVPSPSSVFSIAWGEAIERLLDPADWESPTFYLEVHGQANDPAAPFQAYLWNVTTNAKVTGSDVSTASLVKERVRSGGFSLAAGPNVYRIYFGGEGGSGPYTMYDAVLIVEPV